MTFSFAEPASDTDAGAMGPIGSGTISSGDPGAKPPVGSWRHGATANDLGQASGERLPGHPMAKWRPVAVVREMGFVKTSSLQVGGNIDDFEPPGFESGQLSYSELAKMFVAIQPSLSTSPIPIAGHHSTTAIRQLASFAWNQC